MYLFLPAQRESNIGLTFKAWPELLRGIGALFALLFCKKRDKRLYKVEAFVRIALLCMDVNHFAYAT